VESSRQEEFSPSGRKYQDGAKPLTCARLQLSSERALDYAIPAVPSEATKSGAGRFLLLQNDVVIQADSYADVSARLTFPNR
jgi:hypothetical protein